MSLYTELRNRQTYLRTEWLAAHGRYANTLNTEQFLLTVCSKP